MFLPQPTERTDWHRNTESMCDTCDRWFCREDGSIRIKPWWRSFSLSVPCHLSKSLVRCSCLCWVDSVFCCSQTLHVFCGGQFSQWDIWGSMYYAHFGQYSTFGAHVANGITLKWRFDSVCHGPRSLTIWDTGAMFPCPSSCHHLSTPLSTPLSAPPLSTPLSAPLLSTPLSTPHTCFSLPPPLFLCQRLGSVSGTWDVRCGFFCQCGGNKGNGTFFWKVLYLSTVFEYCIWVLFPRTPLYSWALGSRPCVDESSRYVELAPRGLVDWQRDVSRSRMGPPLIPPAPLPSLDSARGLADMFMFHRACFAALSCILINSNMITAPCGQRTLLKLDSALLDVCFSN